MVKTFGAPRECGAPEQLPLLPPPPLSGPDHNTCTLSKYGNLSTIVVIWEVSSYVLYYLCLYIRKYSSTLYVGSARKKWPPYIQITSDDLNLC